MRLVKLSFFVVAIAGVLMARAARAADPVVGFEDKGKILVITLDGKPLAEYKKSGDSRTTRPYTRHLYAPTGQQVSINNPTKKGEPNDHHGYHTGLWFGFKLIGGLCPWKLEDRVAFVEYIEKPTGGPGKGSFAVKNRYIKGKKKDGKTQLTSVNRYTYLVRPHGTLILLDATFSSDTIDIVFGDVEEMGLAIRVNAPMNVERTRRNRKEKPGRMINSLGDMNEGKIRARNRKQPVDWCDYSGYVDGKFVGVTLMSHPKNFSKPWWHARDYGVLVCNPFARKDLGGGKESRVVVKKGEKFQIRFGVLLHGNDKPEGLDLKAAYQDYLSVIGEN